MLDKFTFGNAPAAIYLVERLNHLNNKKFTRKVSTIICEFRKIIGELIKSHQSGTVSTHSLACMIELLHIKIEQSHHILLFNDADYNNTVLPDELAANLMLNVLKGELKSVFRRSRNLHHMEKTQFRLSQKLYSTEKAVRDKSGMLLGYDVRKFEPKKINIDYISEEITAKTLQEKSRKKLKRLNKKCELY